MQTESYENMSDICFFVSSAHLRSGQQITEKSHIW